MTRKNLYRAPNKILGVWTIILLFSFLPQHPKAQINYQTESSINEIAEIEQKAAMNHFLSATKNSMLSAASSNVDIHHIVCNWNIDPAIRYIQGDIKFGFTITEKISSITFDLANELIVDSVRYKNNKLTFLRPSNNSVVINLGVTLEKNIKDEIIIFYKGVPPVANSPFSTFTNSTHAGVPVMWTLSEPYGGRDWWPCKQSLNDKKHPVRLE